MGLTVLFTKINLMIEIQSSCIEKIVSRISVSRLWSLITKKQGKGWWRVVSRLALQFYVIALDSIYFSMGKEDFSMGKEEILPRCVIMTTVQIFGCITF